MSSVLPGKVALITGASGGIGSAVARRMAEHGCSLALHCSSNRKAADALSRELKSLNVQSAVFQADLSLPGRAKGLVQDVLKRFKRLDILVNNAGAVIGDEHFTELSEADWDKTIRLNAGSPFFLMQEAFKAMTAGGRIINVSSIAAKFGGSARSIHYGAAKAALEAMTAGLAREGAARGVLVNAIRAGVIDTPFHEKFKKDMNARVAMIPMKRMGTAAEVARLAHFLATDGAYITGQVLAITGGE